MPFIRRGAPLLGLLFVLVAACSSGEGNTDPDLVGQTPETVVAVASPQLAEPDITLETTQATTYYTVTGSTTEEIFASIEANGPTDDQGRKGSGLTSVNWEYAWTGDVTPSGACSIRDLTITADIVVNLPQHANADSLPENLQEKWQTYSDGVAAHEQHHVDIYMQGAQTIKTALENVGVATSCDELTTEIDTIWNTEQDKINRDQQTFHQEENLRLAAARDPLSKQIEANRAQLSSLQDQIASLDDQIARLRSELSVFDTEVANVDAQIKQINDQFPNSLPDTVKQRLEQLIEQSNNLLVEYNQRVKEHNDATTQRAALSDQYDQLIATTNELVDDFNWTR